MLSMIFLSDSERTQLRLQHKRVRVAVFGFFALLSALTAESVLGQDFKSRVRDRFPLINALATGY